MSLCNKATREMRRRFQLTVSLVWALAWQCRKIIQMIVIVSVWYCTLLWCLFKIHMTHIMSTVQKGINIFTDFSSVSTCFGIFESICPNVLLSQHHWDVMANYSVHLHLPGHLGQHSPWRVIGSAPSAHEGMRQSTAAHISRVGPAIYQRTINRHNS